MRSNVLVLLALGIVCFRATFGHNDYSMEIDTWKHNPGRLVGSFNVRAPDAGACYVSCTEDARLVLDRFSQFTYVNYYTYTENMTGIYQPERAGIRICEETDASLECYKECNRNQTAMGNPVDEPLELKYLKSLKSKHCEGQYTNGYPSCRYADVRHCGQKFRKTQCHEHLDGLYNCVDETLEKSHQDCSGFCTVSRRFKLSDKFYWSMECQLKPGIEQCKILATFTCFKDIKDTDTNLGFYQSFTEQEEYANNLTALCDILEAPIPCLDTLVEGYVDYFGYNVSQPCYNLRDKIADIQKDWGDLIEPFCGHRNRNLTDGETAPTTYKDVCPDPNPLPVTPTTPHYHPVFTTHSTTTPKRVRGDNVMRFGPTWEEKEGKCPTRPLAPGSDCSSCVADSECDDDLKCCDSCCRRPLMRRRVSSGRPKGNNGANSAAATVTLLLPLTIYMSVARQLQLI